MSRTVLITGVAGQDGAYLARLLLEAGDRVVGTSRGPGPAVTARLDRLGIADAVEIRALDLAQPEGLDALLDAVAPDEIYNLAAQSSVRASFDDPLTTLRVNGDGALALLEALRRRGGGARLFQASSSEMFGAATATPQDETTAFAPLSPYASAKLLAHFSTLSYRRAYGLHAVSGIMYNHESPLRGPEFVTRKITAALVRQSLGSDEVLRLGNLDARRDWGFAGDYARGMRAMLRAETPRDFVLATGVTHSVRDFVEAAAACLGRRIAWAGEGPAEIGRDADSGATLVAVDPALFRPLEPAHLVGNPARAARALGWRPEVGFSDLVEMMVAADLAAARGA